MSHFTVLVVTKDRPTEESIPKELAPFHEFECTGADDQYVVNEDVTEDTKKDYERHKKEGQSFAEFVPYWLGGEAVGPGETPDIEDKHKYGWCRVDEKGEVVEVIKRTNPNAKWDWWVVGGRWTGYFKVKQGVTDCAAGRGSVFGDSPRIGYADIIRKGDIDVQGMIGDAAEEASEMWCKVHSAISDDDFDTLVPWEKIVEQYKGNIEVARAAYNSQPAVVKIYRLGLGNVEKFNCSRNEYVNRARSAAIATFAFVRDGKWAERGEMGWWACVANEKTDWLDQFQALWDSIPDDHWVTIVDCHI